MLSARYLNRGEKLDFGPKLLDHIPHFSIEKFTKWEGVNGYRDYVHAKLSTWIWWIIKTHFWFGGFLLPCVGWDFCDLLYLVQVSWTWERSLGIFLEHLVCKYIETEQYEGGMMQALARHWAWFAVSCSGYRMSTPCVYPANQRQTPRAWRRTRSQTGCGTLRSTKRNRDRKIKRRRSSCASWCRKAAQMQGRLLQHETFLDNLMSRKEAMTTSSETQNPRSQWPQRRVLTRMTIFLSRITAAMTMCPGDMLHICQLCDLHCTMAIFL